jgi:hypothetical protein
MHYQEGIIQIIAVVIICPFPHGFQDTLQIVYSSLFA